MNAVGTYTSELSHDARNIRWLLQNFVEEVPGVHSVAVVSSDGLLLLTSQPEPTDAEPPTARSADSAPSGTGPAAAPPATPAPTTSAPTTSAPTTSAPTTPAPTDGASEESAPAVAGTTPAPVIPAQRAGRPGRIAENRMDLAAVVSGVASLTFGAARLMDGGKVRQTTVAMDDGMLFVTSISDGSLLGVHATADCDISVVGYHMALFVGRAGHVLTPALRTELRTVMESAH
ncbi:roadblock/LC7 domain-containing protein [Streptomyces sp. NBC_01190]|uniref:roadblock/LC7 domain-containing protein n=1 Tax=Streptomyces sp. NBC_01190 TaxID=2903767 RepID=UPI0038635951